MDSKIVPYEKYYAIQAGGGIDSWYRGAPVQRGHGIGSFLGGLFRAALPLFRKGALAVGKEALNAGVNVLDDIGYGVPLKTSLNMQMNNATNNLKRKATDKVMGLLKGEGYKPKKKRKQTQSKKVTRRRKSTNSRSKKKESQKASYKKKKESK
ncbi:hypothetical protein V9T40_012556 [Parthenolecanium corni]|uniref:Uncharacterized protein n=1 Tax=Parthenolecanium corni TaxID=536013 RepID=A0AAN9Y0J8_9HEMI